MGSRKRRENEIKTNAPKRRLAHMREDKNNKKSDKTKQKKDKKIEEKKRLDAS